LKRGERCHSLSVLTGTDSGHPVCGSGLVTSNATLRDAPDLVKRFVAA
jgi:NitT/TauT family transport system substrate-binding protein